jgi:hypothetical protein
MLVAASAVVAADGTWDECGKGGDSDEAGEKLSVVTPLRSRMC